MVLCLVLAAVASFTLFVNTPLPMAYDHRRDALVKYVTGAKTTFIKSVVQYPATLKTTNSKYAFATLLASDALHPNDQDNLHDDYFIATRLLAYQILHAPETRSKDTPFIVLATKGVSEAKRERLRRDGAIVLAVETVKKPSWIEGGPSNWEEVFDKLRLWELTQFDRICFLDGDTVLNRQLDGVFLDTAAAAHNTLDHSDKLRSDEAPLPPFYVFAGQPEMNREHHYPPSEATHDYPNVHYLNAGFFVMQPSLELLNHYLSIMAAPDRFVPKFPEQNLLNYAHRSEADGGNMPWQLLNSQWNLHYPTLADVKGGVASLHEKWWAPGDKELGPYLNSWRWRMEGFHEALDELK
jgi:alpha-N-acetylglucosamine transferase